MAATTSSSASSKPATQPTTTTTTAGAWETVMDHACGSVLRFLSTSADGPIDVEAPLGRCMLQLLDRNTVREIVADRNYAHLCGRFGCANLPRGLRDEELRAKLSFDWMEDEENNNNMDDDGGDDDASREQPSSPSKQQEQEEDPEEYVYADDGFIAESFRMAKRQQQQLQRLQQKQRREREKKMATANNNNNNNNGDVRSSTATIRPIIPSGEAGGAVMFGATLHDRFCCVECVDYHQEEIYAKVASFFSYGDVRLVSAVATLFPALRLDVLQRLASVEHVAGPIVDRGASSCAAPTTTTTATTSSSPDEDVVEQSLRQSLQSMEVLRHVWAAEVLTSNTMMQSTCHARENKKKDGDDDDDDVRRGGVGYNSGGVPALRGSWLVMDFLLSIITAEATQLVRLHFVAQASSIMLAWQQLRPDGVLHRILSPIISRLDAWRDDWCANNNNNNNAARIIELLTSAVSQSPSVLPALQQQRRELLSAAIFSSDSAAHLARLTCIDYVVVWSAAWMGMWRTTPPTVRAAMAEHNISTILGSDATVMSSLRFCFPLPSKLLQPTGASVESMGLALVCLCLSACCCVNVMRALSSSEDALEEVMEAMKLSAEEVQAALSIFVPE